MVRLFPLGCIILLHLGWQSRIANGNPIAMVKAAVAFSFELYKQVEQLRNPLKGDDLLSQMELKTFSKLDSISESIEDLKTDIRELSDGLTSKIVDKTKSLFESIDNIDFLYDTFMTYISNQDTPPEILNAFVDQLTSDSSVELYANMNKIHKTLINHDINEESIISVIANLASSKLMCARGQSSQQTIIELHKAVVLRDSMGVAMRLFAFDQKEKRENTSYKFMKDTEIKKFSQRMEKTLKEVLPALRKTSREIWKCDPKQHQNGLTYSKLGVFQTHIAYENDFATRALVPCSYSCSSYEETLQFHPNGYRRGHKKLEMCRGTLRECQTISHHMSICYADDSSDRRYLWMKSDTGVTYGRQTSCNDTQEVESQPGFASLFYCEHCVCTCETRDKNIQRYFSLANATSPIQLNRVVTGVKFNVKDNIFHIQIQHGVLGPNGTIDSKTVEWEPNELPFKISDQVYDSELVYNVNWYNKSVYLDDIEPPIPASHPKVVTGLAFKKINNYMQLQVQMMEFNYTTGKLSEVSEWHSNDKARTDIVPFVEVDDPVWKHTHVENSHSGQYLNFQITDLHKDFGQNTIPYIDFQNVTSNPPLPLSGAGIFHKGSKGSGGFLALKIIQYDFTKHININ